MAPPSLRLWISPGTCSLAPHVLLRESGLPFTLITIDITKGGFPADKAHINPKKRLPILEINPDTAETEILTETVAIMTYICRLVPEKHLFGNNDLEVARTYEWLNWLSGTVHERGMGAMFTPAWYSDDEAAHDGIRMKSRAWVDHCFGLIEERLSGCEHATKAEYTAADVFLWVIYRWGYLIAVDMEKDYPNWTKVVGFVVQREAVKEAVEIEGIPMVKDNRLPPEVQDRFNKK